MSPPELWAEEEEEEEVLETPAPALSWDPRAPCWATVLRNTLIVPRRRWRRSEEEATQRDRGGHVGGRGYTDSLTSLFFA